MMLTGDGTGVREQHPFFRSLCGWRKD